VLRRGRRDRLGASADEVGDELADHFANGLAAFQLRFEVGIPPLDTAQVLGEERHRGELVQRDQTRPQPVIDVVVVVGDFIRDVRELCLEPRLGSIDEALADVAEVARMLQRAMLENSLASLESEVEPAEACVPILEVIDDSERLQVVLEAAEIAHAFVERILAGMAKRGVTEIVSKADRFDEILVQA
jgi:hypothetical protein